MRDSDKYKIGPNLENWILVSTLEKVLQFFGIKATS